MTATGSAAGNLVRALRRRVRLRTRLRRAREVWRRARRRRLPQWSETEAPGRASSGDSTEITVETLGGLRRFGGSDDPVRSLRLTVSDWHTPYHGWSGRLGPLPGLVRHEVVLPDAGRGPATVALTLAEPLPLSRIVAAVRAALTPQRPLPRAASVDAQATGTAVVVDATVANPRGRTRHGPHLPAGWLTVDPDHHRWEITRSDDRVTVVAGHAGEPLDQRQSAVLTQLGAVSVADGAGGPAVASVLAQLAMTGVVLHAPRPPSDLLAPALARLISSPLPDPAADPLEWELRSVAQRRAAMRHHAAGLRAPDGHPGLTRPPSVSALLVTKRPQLLRQAVAAMAAQTYPELEMVVVLHGAAPPADLRLPGPVLTVAAQWSLGEALGAATRAASGSLVTKVDDDDRYGPEHVWDLVLARHYSGATVAGKGAEFVYLEPKDLTVRRRMGCEDFTDTVAGGTILLARGDLEAIGGWPPVPRSVDRGLLDRVLAAGGLIYRTHPFGFIYTRHSAGHTWDPGLDYFLTDPARKWSGLPSYEEFSH